MMMVVDNTMIQEDSKENIEKPLQQQEQGSNDSSASALPSEEEEQEKNFISLIENEYNKNPTFMKLSFHLLSPKHAQLLCQHHTFSSLAVPCTIRYLDLTGNQIKNEGCKYIAQMLAHNESIEVLNLSMNDISASGVKHLCQVLSNKHVENQQHSTTFIHSPRRILSPHASPRSSSSTTTTTRADASQQQLTQHKNFTLKHLDLSMNRLGNEGMEHLSNMLRNNTTLVTLSVRSNKVKSQDGVSRLLEMLAIAHASDTLQEVFV